MVIPLTDINSDCFSILCEYVMLFLIGIVINSPIRNGEQAVLMLQAFKENIKEHQVCVCRSS